MGSAFLGLDAATAVLEASNRAVLNFGPRGLEKANQAAVELLGLPRTGIIGLAPWELIEPRPPSLTKPGICSLAGKLLLGPRSGRAVSGRIRVHGDDRQTWVFDISSRLSGVDAIAVEWVQSLAGPLSIIRASAEMAARRFRPDLPVEHTTETITRALDQIIDQVDWLSGSAGDLLGKIWGEAEGRPRELDINQIIRGEVAVLKGHPAFMPSIKLKLELSPKVPVIKGLYSDFSHSIRQVLLNALEALDKADEKKLLISSRLQEGELIITIIDTGCGIPQELLPRLFEPFSTTRVTAKPTAGLGLSSVRQLLQPYQAEIKVKSRPGLTSFNIHLNLKRLTDED